MSLVGNLQDLALVDIFQILALSRKSGILWLSRDNASRGKIILSSGKIVGAWSPRSPEFVSRLLSSENVTLPLWLFKPEDEGVDNLGAFRSYLNDTLPDLGRQLSFYDEFVRMTTTDLLSWRVGTFRFDMRGNLPSEAPLPQEWICLSEGVDPVHIGMEGARLDDERSRGELALVPKVELGVFSDDRPVDLLADLRDQFESVAAERANLNLSPGLSLLKTMLFELHVPDVHTYITLLVLRYASVVLNRAILFEVKAGQFVGLGEFGLSSDKKQSAELVRGIHIPFSEPSFLRKVVEEPYPTKIGPNLDVQWDRYFIGKLGGTPPTEMFLGPIMCRQRLVGILYGDNLPEKKPIGDTESLEIFLSQAGLAMERALSSGDTSL